MQFSRIAATAACAFAPVSAVYQGFNYGATKSDGVTVRVQSDYEALFSTAKGLAGTNSAFTSARLYTTIQGGTANSPNLAIPAAIAQGTSLLLGIWGSGGQAQVDNEITALKAAISTYGSKFTSLVAGISVGSEDLYRDSTTGQLALAGIGAGPAVISSYIKQVKAAIAGTTLSGAPIGHVDTWTAWVNGTNTAVIDACDFIGFDAYPYFQNTQANSIENGKSLFLEALDNTKAAVGSKEIWVTESGWPVTGSTQGQAVPSVANAKTYWDAVACPLLGVTNTWWFTLEDSDVITTNPQFGVANGKPLSTTPYYDLSCSNITSSSSTSSSASASATGSSSASGSASGSASASASGGSSASGAASSAGSSETAVVSSGGGLSPSGGQNGIGSASVTTTAITTSAGSASTGAAGAGAGSNSTVAGGTIKSTATGSTSTAASTPTLAVGNSGNVIAGSFVGAVAGLVAAFAL